MWIAVLGPGCTHNVSSGIPTGAAEPLAPTAGAEEDEDAALPDEDEDATTAWPDEEAALPAASEAEPLELDVSESSELEIASYSFGRWRHASIAAACTSFARFVVRSSRGVNRISRSHCARVSAAQGIENAPRRCNFRSKSRSAHSSVSVVRLLCSFASSANRARAEGAICAKAASPTSVKPACVSTAPRCAVASSARFRCQPISAAFFALRGLSIFLAGATRGCISVAIASINASSVPSPLTPAALCVKRCVSVDADGPVCGSNKNFDSRAHCSAGWLVLPRRLQKQKATLM